MDKCINLIVRVCSSSLCICLKGKRNRYIRCFEHGYLLLCFAVFILAIIQISLRTQMANMDLFEKGHDSLKKLQDRLILFGVFFSLIAIICSILGCVVAKKRNCHAGLIVIFGIVLFFLGAIPSLVATGTINGLRYIEKESLDRYCQMDQRQLSEHHVFIRSFFEFAHRFDELSERYISTYMCTEKCPCNNGVNRLNSVFSLLFEVNKNKKKFLNSEEMYRQDIHRDLLEQHKRYFAPPVRKNEIEMVFTNDTSKGFWTFKECLEKTKLNASQFAFDFEKERDPDAFEKDEEVFMHPEELELYQTIEDDFICSGMCQPSLFFYRWNITYGPPRHTCLQRFKHYLDQETGSLSVVSALTGVGLLFMFFFHFGMYCRPLPAEQANASPDPTSEMIQVAQNRARAYQEGDKEEDT